MVEADLLEPSAEVVLGEASVVVVGAAVDAVAVVAADAAVEAVALAIVAAVVELDLCAYSDYHSPHAVRDLGLRLLDCSMHQAVSELWLRFGLQQPAEELEQLELAFVLG